MLRQLHLFIGGVFGETLTIRGNTDAPRAATGVPTKGGLKRCTLSFSKLISLVEGLLESLDLTGFAHSLSMRGKKNLWRGNPWVAPS